MVKVGCYLSKLVHCCGVVEIGSILEDDDIDDNYIDYQTEGETEEQAYAKLLDQVRTNPENLGYFMQVWFVRLEIWNGRHSPKYESSALRDLVRTIPGVISLGTTINPNTRNKIDGYLWLNS